MKNLILFNSQDDKRETRFHKLEIGEMDMENENMTL
jgi:hypothetical protein